ncbi:MAG: phosphoribosylformylglycinamidine cyclo-ligase [Epulopiscium sp.]|jgi:phosphoribosylformylglycinamidine cyclo-ligase|nr:phosphoribosylformylglycinamidine cyclo-ligase [Candidatus Epulonipiscium sp.]
MDYKSAGVDVEAGYEAVRLMKDYVKSTYRPEVLTDIGGFGGLFSIAKNKMKEPVLVSGTDGVGTKLKIAFVTDKHDTIGIDCVAMCANDVACSGAEPLFFLDYIACGKNIPKKIAEIVKGVAEGCKQAGAALIGGETAEMPGFYPEDEYDLAGFCVGIVDKEKIIDGSRIKKGDILIGLASSGIHSNGYSLIRKIFNPNKDNVNEYIELLGCTLGEELLKPTKIYVNTINKLKEAVDIKGISHITGGGFIENIPRAFPKGLGAKVYEGTWEILPIFKLTEELGNVSRMSMYNTFNMGIGMVIIIDESEKEKALSILSSIGEKAYLIGEVVESETGVEICTK